MRNMQRMLAARHAKLVLLGHKTGPETTYPANLTRGDHAP
jgi:hypothetical protein